MKNIHVSLTDKPSRLCKDEYGKFYLTDLIESKVDFFKNQHIYITSDEEIPTKDGEWYFKKIRGSWRLVNYFPHKIKLDNNAHFFDDCRKIILTTDQDLIKDGVQAIDDEFLEWFVKNPSCELIEYDKNYNRGNGKYYYKIITPEKKPNIIDKCLEINEFVSYQQALALKELGFDEKCLYGYDTFGTVISTSTKWENWNQSLQLVSAPLYQQGFRWFRKKHGIFSSVWCFETEHKFFIEFGFGIQKFEVADKENTELECLKKLIEIVKEKK